VWKEDDDVPVPSATATEYADPLPSPPLNELQNHIALSTIASRPDLFKIVTPINVDIFESYLATHPNPLFVRSVCRGLREGFWPWADTSDPELPTTWDNSKRPLRDLAHQIFIEAQRDEEISLGQFSSAFGPDLLPGMYSMPVGVVPKPHTEKLRMVFDHSAEPHSLNSMIAKHERSLHLDTLTDLGRALRKARKTIGPNHHFVVFKSDVSRAYRLLPMHPLWQIRQIITIDGLRYVDRCNQFGNGAAGRLWGCVMGLVLWIAIFVKGIPELFSYVDDEFSYDLAGNEKWYSPYHKRMPSKQVRLLELWDELGIPHEERKQLFGPVLTIIGFDVDPNAMTITMPDEARSNLVLAIHDFAIFGRRYPLRDFQCLAGWINWALNAFPLLRPGLSALYDKMSGKEKVHQPMWMSKTICRELWWIAQNMQESNGVLMMDSVEWTLDCADLVLFTDACPKGLGFWIPMLALGFQYPVIDGSTHDILFYESLAVLSALAHVITHFGRPRMRLAVLTDSFGTVEMFNSLRAKPAVNSILLTAASLLISSGLQFRVFHTRGQDNVVADALSRFRNDIAYRCIPNLVIFDFQPPRLTLGADAI
jgi:hypothetical protein